MQQIELGKHRKTVNSSSNKTPSSKRRKSAISFNATEPEAENEILEQEKMFPLPSVGDYIALRCFKYKDYIPQIAKIRCISESDMEVEWLDGSYTGIWVP